MFKFCRSEFCRSKFCTLEFCIDTRGVARRPFWADDGGSTAIEYALIAAGVSIVIVASVVAIGSGVQGMFQTVASALK